MSYDFKSLSLPFGYVSAVPTPFLGGDGAIDDDAFSAFCRRQIADGIAGLVVCGTTGEAPTLTAEEHRCLVGLAVRAAAGRAPVIVGAGSNNTATAAALARSAENAGADAVLAVVPYYNKPSQEGMYWHFRTIAEATGLPVILYDVPSRTGCGLAVETIVRLAEVPGIVGLKDASGDLGRVGKLRRQLGYTFRLYGGDDATALGFLAMGGDGCISVTSNVAPALCVGLYAAVQGGDMGEAQRIALILDELTAALFNESNPVPVKAALELMGLLPSAVRLPLVGATGETRRRLIAALEHACIPTVDNVVRPESARLSQWRPAALTARRPLAM